MTIQGRGATGNPPGRFEKLRYEPDEELPPDERPSPRTVFLVDATRSALVRNDSPDVGFDVSVNPYRGCEHGCIYCYARPTHEYLGFSAGLDFETKILVKPDLPALLREELMSTRFVPETIAISGVTDPYQPVERTLRLTRGCLEVLAEFRNPVSVISKNELIARDADVLGQLARVDAAQAIVSITTLDPALARILEPRTSTPERRLAAIEALAAAGVPVSVNVAPVIPALNDHEIPAILAAAAKAGATAAAYLVLRLPGAVAPLFEAWLSEHFPDRKAKILNRLRNMHGGKLNDPRFGKRMRGEGPFADEIRQLFTLAARRAGLNRRQWKLSTAAFRRPVRPGAQLTLW